MAVVRADPVPPDALDPGAAAAPTSETPRLPLLLPLPLLPSPLAAAPARSRVWPTFGARRVVAALAVVAVVGVMTAIPSPRAPDGPVADLATAASTGTRGPAIREPAVRPEPRSEAVARSLAAAPLPAVDASGLNPLRMTAVAAGSASAAVLVAPLAALRLGPAASEDVAAPPTATKRAVRAVSRKDVARQRAARLAEGRQAPPPPASAREVCAGGHFIARAMCMDRECERPPYRQTAECTRVLSVKRERIERRAAL